MQHPTRLFDSIALGTVATAGLALLGLVALVTLSNWASGWTRASRLFGPPPLPTASWSRCTTCIVQLGRFPVSLGACERGLVIKPLYPLSLLKPTVWAPWDDIELQGPRWHWGTYEDIAIRGFQLAVPARFGERIRGAQRGWRRFDERV